MMAPEHVEVVDDFTAFGVHGFTTTRAFGTVSATSDEPTHVVMRRWDAVRETVGAHGIGRLATATQVHGARVLAHEPGWEGWLRAGEADGHFASGRDTALSVTIADCVPVFIAHPGGAVALLHSGWRGTVARIVEQGVAAFARCGLPAAELRMHLGPAICGRCYEVSADVARQLTGRTPPAPSMVDLRLLIADHARMAGVKHLSCSRRCTKCDNAHFFSHRGGDAGRQLAVIFAKS